MTDAILFSADLSLVDIDAAIQHLKEQKELYWEVGFKINKNQFSFPLFGFIHISGGQVEYRALVEDILSFSRDHYENPSLAESVKPGQWRAVWISDPRQQAHSWNTELVMTEIVPFPFDTYSIEKYGGGLITHPPQGNYARVIPPNQSPGSTPAQPSPMQPSPISIAEKNPEEFDLDAIEPGLDQSMNEKRDGPRLQQRYLEVIRPALAQEFGYRNLMQVPKLEKIVINMGVGEAAADQKKLDAAVTDLALIAGQKPVKTLARKAIAAFKIRKGLAIGCKVTLRRARMYEFLDRLVTIALPRVRDFRGIAGKGFDGRGNFALGLKEQIVFPEINYDKVDAIRGMDIVFVTTACSDAEARALLQRFGLPFVA